VSNRQTYSSSNLVYSSANRVAAPAIWAERDIDLRPCQRKRFKISEILTLTLHWSMASLVGFARKLLATNDLLPILDLMLGKIGY